MNKIKTLLLSTILTIGFVLPAQDVEITRHVFAAGSNSTTIGSNYLSSTIGQSGLVGSFAQGDIILIAGFQHYDLQVGIEDMDYNVPPLKVYPNPFHDNFYFSLDLEINQEFSYYMYDNTGKRLFEKLCIPVSTTPLEEMVELTNCPPGIYNLVVFIYSDNHSTKKISIKLIKL